MKGKGAFNSLPVSWKAGSTMNTPKPMKPPTEPKPITVLRQLLIGTSNADDNGVRHIQKYARLNGIDIGRFLALIPEAMLRRDQLIRGAKQANKVSGATIVIYEDKYCESDEQRFNYAPDSGYLILCPHAEPIGKVIDGQFIPRMKTCWESDGTDGPVVLTTPPDRD